MQALMLIAALILQVLANEVEVVIDTSGSMKGREKEVLSVVRSLLQKKASDKIGITLFNNTTQRVLSIPKNLTMNGGTNLTDALSVAKKYNPKSIIIITDGKPNNEIKAAEKMQELKDQGIVICSAYIGDGNTPLLLKKHSHEVFTTRDMSESLNQCLRIPEVKKIIEPAPKEETLPIIVPDF